MPAAEKTTNMSWSFLLCLRRRSESRAPPLASSEGRSAPATPDTGDTPLLLLLLLLPTTTGDAVTDEAGGGGASEKEELDKGEEAVAAVTEADVCPAAGESMPKPTFAGTSLANGAGAAAAEEDEKVTEDDSRGVDAALSLAAPPNADVRRPKRPSKRRFIGEPTGTLEESWGWSGSSRYCAMLPRPLRTLAPVGTGMADVYEPLCASPSPGTARWRVRAPMAMGSVGETVGGAESTGARGALGAMALPNELERMRLKMFIETGLLSSAMVRVGTGKMQGEIRDGSVGKWIKKGPRAEIGRAHV